MAAPWCGFDRNAGKERKSQRRAQRWKTSERADSVAEDDSAVREGYPALKSERKKSGQSNVEVPKEKEEERIYIQGYIERDTQKIEKKGRKREEKEKKESDGAIPRTRDRRDDENPEAEEARSLAFSFYPADLDSFGQTASQPVRPSSNARIFIRFLATNAVSERKKHRHRYRSMHKSSTVPFEPRISGAQRCESAATCSLPFVNELLRAYGHSSPGINYIISLTPPSSVMNLRAHVNAEFECA
ncbi:hypothetical protein G5I_04302 [Acromyrmex echinatior]|uniref:Uncharacterized protein n=1 Tax=Acromyrmex echinatior TaxID=103372 RepID=F4WF95_ACREC|nr:hypothetical protein G5I_04302 [Acromyrmex echinatior]